MVENGEQRLGVPVTMKLRDSNGDLLAVNTEMRFEVLLAGHSDPVAVSERVEDISSWNTLSITEQRKNDYVDATKIMLQESESRGGDPVGAVSWRDIDEFRVAIESASQIDWSQSEFSFPSNAVKGPNQRRD
jgi:hypothetical protein